jgi:hypothetical protein
VPSGPFLRWSLLAALPTAAAATTIGLLAPHRPAPPDTTWLDWLTTPPGATALAAAGMLLVQFGHTNDDPILSLARALAPYLGAALLGVGVALTLPIHLRWQLITAPPLTLATLILTLGGATAALATLYVLAVTGRWLTHTSRLLLPTRAAPTP